MAEATDPRSKFNVSHGLYPDCPDCQGLMPLKHVPPPPPPPDSYSFGVPDRIVVPCQTCDSRRLAAGLELAKKYYKGNGTSVPYGTWPDCTKCKGLGGNWYQYGFDGHNSETGFNICKVCQNRTDEYHRLHPTELDLLLFQQRDELQPLKDHLMQLQLQVKSCEKTIAEMSAEHKQALSPHLDHIQKWMYDRVPIG